MGYDHTHDVPPHQHGGTDAPECTTCRPAGKVEGYHNLIGEQLDEWLPKLTSREEPQVTYYGTAQNLGRSEFLRALQDRARRPELSKRPDYLEWRDEVYGSSPWNGMSESLQPEQGGTMPDRNVGQGPKYEGNVDNERKWNRGQLLRLMRLELVALGLLPEGDGFIQPPTTPSEPDEPAPDGHYWDGYKWVELEPRTPDQWAHMCEVWGEARTLLYGEKCERCGKSERDFMEGKWSVDHPPIHHEWIDGYKIGDRVYHPSDVTILLKQAPNFAEEQPELPGRRDVEQSIRHLTEHLDRGELLCKCYDNLDNFGARKD